MDNYELKCSEVKQTFPTGAVRDKHEGKGRFDLLPVFATERLAIHFEKGAVKYGADNYLKGINLRRYLDSALRHIFKYLAKQKDEDHLVAAAWNLMAGLETEHRARTGILPPTLLDCGPYIVEPPSNPTVTIHTSSDGVICNATPSVPPDTGARVQVLLPSCWGHEEVTLTSNVLEYPDLRWREAVLDNGTHILITQWQNLPAP